MVVSVHCIAVDAKGSSKIFASCIGFARQIVFKDASLVGYLGVLLDFNILILNVKIA